MEHKILKSYKLLAFDLDGTILTDDGHISTRMHEAIKRASEVGHTITVLTGRTEKSARAWIELLNIKTPYATSQGAYITDYDGTILQHIEISSDVIQVLINYGCRKSKKRKFFISTKLGRYVDDKNSESWSYLRKALGADLLDFSNYKGESADRVVLVCEQAHNLHNELLLSFPNFTYNILDDQHIEVFGPNANKGQALQELAKILKFKQKDVIAFGNGTYDIPMFNWAGYSVGVGDNSLVLEAATVNVSSPNNYGVAQWLESFCSLTKL